MNIEDIRKYLDNKAAVNYKRIKDLHVKHVFTNEKEYIENKISFVGVLTTFILNIICFALLFTPVFGPVFGDVGLITNIIPKIFIPFVMGGVSLGSAWLIESKILDRDQDLIKLYKSRLDNLQKRFECDIEEKQLKNKNKIINNLKARTYSFKTIDDSSTNSAEELKKIKESIDKGYKKLDILTTKEFLIEKIGKKISMGQLIEDMTKYGIKGLLWSLLTFIGPTLLLKFPMFLIISSGIGIACGSGLAIKIYSEYKKVFNNINNKLGENRLKGWISPDSDVPALEHKQRLLMRELEDCEYQYLTQFEEPSGEELDKSPSYDYDYSPEKIVNTSGKKLTLLPR